MNSAFSGECWNHSADKHSRCGRGPWVRWDYWHITRRPRLIAVAITLGRPQITR